MATPSATDRILAAFSPPLDSALVYAILSDFPQPLSPDDEAAVCDTLQSLAIDADYDPDDRHSDPDTTLLARAHTHAGESSDPQPPRDERAELLALINQATHELQLDRAPSGASGASGSPGGQGDGAASSTSTSDFSGSAPEHSSQDDGAHGSGRRAAQRFWEQSAASFTSDEDGGCARLVWDAPEGGFDLEVQDDPLAFLASVFPHIDLAQLEAKIAEVSSVAPTQDGLAAEPADLEALIEDLLSQDLITALTEADADAAAAANAPAPDPDGLATMDRQQRRRVKAVQKAAHSFSLTSTPHVSYAKAAAHASNPASSALADAPLSTNAWASISSQASFLSACMHVSVSRITSVYHAQGSSLARTVSVLLEQLAHERPFDALAGALELKSQLRLIVPVQKASDDHLEALLSAAEGDLSDALDLHGFIGELEQSGAPLALTALVSRAPSAAASALHSVAGVPEGFTVVSAGRSPTLAAHAVPPTATAPVEERYTFEQCQSRALEYLVKRNDAFRTAARSFQRGGAGERGAAGYWAEKGREYDRERRKWEERVARAAVSERRAKTGTNTVDLHGLTLAQALTIVDEACNTWWTNARDTLHPEPLRIITGVGRHSRNGTPVLGPAVAKHLDREGWRWKWDDGPIVAGGVGPVNARGAVRVLGVAR
ncbi:hypothetical protein JCM3770_007378 [Rhodotorula araucariae]